MEYATYFDVYCDSTESWYYDGDTIDINIDRGLLDLLIYFDNTPYGFNATSSDDNVATVYYDSSQNIVTITPVGVGTATLTLDLDLEGGGTYECTYTMNVYRPVYATNFELDGYSAGDTISIDTGNNNTIQIYLTPSGSEAYRMAASIDDQTVGGVYVGQATSQYPYLEVYGFSEGDATITVSLYDSTNTVIQSYQYTLSVAPQPYAEYINSISGPLGEVIYSGDTGTAYDGRDYYYYYEYSPFNSVPYTTPVVSSSDTNVAEIISTEGDNFYLRTKSVGTTTITVSYESETGPVADFVFDVNVIEYVPTYVEYIESLSSWSGYGTVYDGGTTTITEMGGSLFEFIGYPRMGTWYSTPTAESSDPDIVSIESITTTGVGLNAIANGEATITITYEGPSETQVFTFTAIVDNQAGYATEVNLVGYSEGSLIIVGAGESIRLTYAPYPGGSALYSTPNPTVLPEYIASISSSDENGFTLSGDQRGNTTLYVDYEDENGNISSKQYSISVRTSLNKLLAGNAVGFFKGKLNDRVMRQYPAPWENTVGEEGQLLEVTSTGDVYICKGYDNGYVWDKINTSDFTGTVVQSTGQSTTDVMSQKAVTDIIGDVETALNIINNGTES